MTTGDPLADSMTEQSGPWKGSVGMVGNGISSGTTAEWLDFSANDRWSIPQAEVEERQLAVARDRFHALLPGLPVLRKLAAEQAVEDIQGFDDLARLLFRHNIYKSYPLAALEAGQFDRLTKWLGGLTTQDLSNVDASRCEGIDDWIELLDAQTSIRMLHSSGTTGKLSFLPRTEPEFANLHLAVFRRILESFESEGENEIGDVQSLPVFNCSYETGALMVQRQVMQMRKDWHSDGRVPHVSLYPERMSADALSLGGRLSAADAQGELGRLKLSPGLLAKRDQLIRQARDAPKALDAFFDRMMAFRGQRVIMIVMTLQAFDLSEAARARGLQDAIFAPDSLIFMGGGPKGRDLPDGYERQITSFLGRTPRKGYGMTELVGASAARRCDHGRYHMLPWHIPFLLDPGTGRILPRTGRQTGRFGVFDTLPYTYWGGFLTGDEVSITWDAPCPCGRNGPWLHGEIRRYSQAEGGDDKITCAGAPEAQDRAIRFLIEATE